MSASHESYVKWIQIGKDLGYEGVSLTAFVKERTDEDRDQRIAEREMKKAENAEKIKQPHINGKSWNLCKSNRREKKRRKRGNLN
jgi:hypothetical protein